MTILRSAARFAQVAPRARVDDDEESPHDDEDYPPDSAPDRPAHPTGPGARGLAWRDRGARRQLLGRVSVLSPAPEHGPQLGRDPRRDSGAEFRPLQHSESRPAPQT